jgi:hypothetical protein
MRPGDGKPQHRLDCCTALQLVALHEQLECFSTSEQASAGRRAWWVNVAATAQLITHPSICWVPAAVPQLAKMVASVVPSPFPKKYQF